MARLMKWGILLIFNKRISIFVTILINIIKVLQEKILILDFGSQYTQLIARRIREINVYCEIYPFNHFPAPDDNVKGVILSGSPSSVRDKNAPFPDLSKIKGNHSVTGCLLRSTISCSEFWRRSNAFRNHGNMEGQILSL